MADFLVLLVLVSSLFVSASATMDHFVTESTMTSGQREGPAFFSWFLVSVGADLGGYGRPPGLFESCLIFSITSCLSWCRRRSFRDGVHCDQWTKGRIGFLFMVSCFSRCCGGRFCGSVYRDRWVTRRTSHGGLCWSLGEDNEQCCI
uniref:Secreted protein n=1 Tax=Fagus sylvatica TaxID=28930 RepID=A0A2N9ERS6_FAGSY